MSEFELKILEALLNLTEAIKDMESTQKDLMNEVIFLIHAKEL